MTEREDERPQSPIPKNLFTGKDGDPLRGGIKAAVKTTNVALSTMEDTTNAATTAMLSRVRVIGRQASFATGKAMAVYNDRKNYGPQIVAGTAIALGGLVTVRRGRFPGALAGVAGGGTAYVGVYRMDNPYGIPPRPSMA